MFTGFFVISFWCYSTHSVIGIYCTLLPGVGQICSFYFILLFFFFFFKFFGLGYSVHRLVELKVGRGRLFFVFSLPFFLA